MRAALVLVTVAACKSSTPAATTTVTPKPVEPQETGPCLPPNIEVVGNQHGVLKICEVEDNTSCFSVEPDGSITPVSGQEGPPTHYVDDTQFLDCPTSSTYGCTKLLLHPDPGWDARDGSLSLGGLVAISYQNVDLGILEVWDPDGPTLLGRTELSAPALSAQAYLADFIGDLAMSMLDTNDGRRHLKLWQIGGGKLTHVADLELDATDWATFDPQHAAFLADGVLQIYDLPAATPGTIVDWTQVIDPAEDVGLEGVYVYLYEDDFGGPSAVAVDEYDGGPIAGLGVFDADGKVTRYPVEICYDEGGDEGP